MSLNVSLRFAEENAGQSRNRQWLLAGPGLREIKISALVLFLFAFLAGEVVLADSPHETSQPRLDFDVGRNCVWESDVGNGFRKHAAEAGANVGGGLGLRVFGGHQEHDLIMGDVHAGLMLSGVVARDRFWRGNWELLGQLFGGEQVEPNNCYFVGLAPILRYNFATGTRFVPFVDGGAGVTATDIRYPDLSTEFEFNVQFGFGAHWFFKPNVAATFEGRWLHLSNAGIHSPNQGVNTPMVLIGVNWFF